MWNQFITDDRAGMMEMKDRHINKGDFFFLNKSWNIWFCLEKSVIQPVGMLGIHRMIWIICEQQSNKV